MQLTNDRAKAIVEHRPSKHDQQCHASHHLGDALQRRQVGVFCTVEKSGAGAAARDCQLFETGSLIHPEQKWAMFVYTY
jgi:hypothetical protein